MLDVEAILRRLWDHICWIHAEWAAYRALFCHSPERVRELNRRSGTVVGLFQRSLGDSVLLGITRLLDGAGRDDKERLSFGETIELLRVDDSTRGRLRERLRALNRTVKGIRGARDKRIAHHDLKVELGLAPVEGVNPGQTTQAIKDMARFYSDIANLHRGENRGHCYDRTEQDVEADVATFLKVLDAGNRQLDAHAKDLREGFQRVYGDEPLPEHLLEPEP